MAGSKKVVIAAMIANGGIAILKFMGFLLTASPSMLAETYHSISDTGNQVLLLIGIRYSERSESSAHPFGYGKAQFFYAFLVSVLLFGVAGWESFKHGLSKLQGHGGGHGTKHQGAEVLGFTFKSPIDVNPFYIASAVLVGGIIFESYAFLKANKELKSQIETHGWSGYKEAFNKTSDITTLTAFTEDTVALIGLVVALAGLVAKRVTGIEAFDALGAIVIGLLLMVFAAALAIENKRLILGESLTDDVETDLRAAINNQNGVTAVRQFRTMFIGAGKVLLTADVGFDPELSADEIDSAIEQIETNLEEVDDRVNMIYIEPETAA